MSINSFHKFFILSIVFVALFFVFPNVSFGQTYTLEVIVDGVDGQITGSGINCERQGNSTIGPTCSASFSAGETVNLAADAINNNHYFRNWEGACSTPTPGGTDNNACSFVIDSNVIVTANFRPCGDGVSGAYQHQRCMIYTFYSDPVVVEPDTTFTIRTRIRDRVDDCWLHEGGLSGNTCAQGGNPIETLNLGAAAGGWYNVSYNVIGGITSNQQYCLRCRDERTGWFDRSDTLTTWAVTDPVNGDNGDNGGDDDDGVEGPCGDDGCFLTVTVVNDGSETQGSVTGSGGLSEIDCAPPAGENEVCFIEEIPEGTSGTLTANTQPGTEFWRWEGACSGSSLTCDLTMENSLSVTATFFTEGELPPDGNGGGNGNGGGGLPPTPPTPLPEFTGVLQNPFACADLWDCLERIANFLFIITTPIFMIAIMVGGFMLMFSAGDEKRYARGREILTYAVVGFAIVLVAFGIPSLIVSILT